MAKETDYDPDIDDDIEIIFGFSMTENPTPLLLLMWTEDRGTADDSACCQRVFDSLDEAELALELLKLDPACSAIIACWQEDAPDPRTDYIPF